MSCPCDLERGAKSVRLVEARFLTYAAQMNLTGCLILEFVALWALWIQNISAKSTEKVSFT